MPRPSQLLKTFSFVGVLLVNACTDQTTAPPAIVATGAITNAITAAQFSLQAPLGSAVADPLTFDASATPVVEVCAWSGTACVGAPLVRFSTTPSGSDAMLQVDAVNGRFSAPWNLMSTTFTTRKTYRIRVLESGAEIGAVSVDVVRGRWALTRTDGTLAPLVSATDLPIRFAVQERDAPLLPESQSLVALAKSMLTAAHPENEFQQILDGLADMETNIGAAKMADQRQAISASAYSLIDDVTAIQNVNKVLGGLVFTPRSPISASSLAKMGTGPTARKTPLTVLYINGVDNSPLDAADGVLQLGATLRDRLGWKFFDGTDSYRLKHVYNSSAAYVAQPSLLCYLFKFSCILHDLTQAGQQIADIHAVWPSAAQPAAVKLAQTISSEIAQGRQVVVVAHSQGNLMTQQALALLPSVNCVGVVSVAAPTSIGWLSLQNRRTSMITQGQRVRDILLELPSSYPNTESRIATVQSLQFDQLLPATAAPVLSPQWVAYEKLRLSYGIELHSFANYNLFAGQVLADRMQQVDAAIQTACPAPTPPTPPATPNPTAGNSGVSFNDPHIWTIDGFTYDFMAVGDFILSKSTDPTDDFEIHARYRKMAGRPVSLNDSYAARVMGDVVNIYPTQQGFELVINQENVPATLSFNRKLPGGGTVQVTNGGAAISWPDRTVLNATSQGVSVLMSPARVGKIAGLLGNYDGDRLNDLRMKDGSSLPPSTTPSSDISTSSPAFRDSWRVALNAPEALFQRGPDLWDPTFPGIIPAIDQAALASGRIKCRAAGVLSADVLEACAHDIAVTGDDSWAAVSVKFDPAIIAVTTAPALTYITVGLTRNFTAAVTGATDRAVTWSTDGGTISSTGASSMTYTAPLTPGQYTITARSVESGQAVGTSTAIVSAVNALPVTTIVQPSNGIIFDAGQSVNFAATATDTEDGTLTGSSLVWSSNRDGQFGTSNTVAINSLSVGTHVISFKATDSQGGSTTSTISVTINARPSVTLQSPANAANFATLAPISFAAQASDPEDGALGNSAFSWSSNLDGPIGTGASFINSNLSAGTHTITVTVTDSHGATASTSVQIIVSNAFMSIPASLSVPYATSASLPIQLATPAPAGGVSVSISTSNPSVVSVLTPIVFIAAGAHTANAQVLGTAPGVATLRATAPGFTSPTAIASVGAALNIIQGSVGFVANRTGTFTVQLESNGQPVAAPASGILVSFASTNSCTVVPAPVQIPPGQVNASVTVSYGNVMPLPCTATLTASVNGQPITTDIVQVRIDPIPNITFGQPTGIRVGAGLRSSCQTINLATPATAGLPLTLTSANAAQLRVAVFATQNCTGASVSSAVSSTVALTAGQSAASFVVDGMESQTGSVTVTADVPGYNNATAAIFVAPLAFRWASAPASFTTLSSPQPLSVGVGPINAAGTASAGDQAIRPSGFPLSVELTSSNRTVAELQTIGGGIAASVVATIVPGQMFSTTSGAGAPQIRPVAAGTTNVSMALVGTAQGLVPAAFVTTVVAPGMTFINPTGARVGAGLRSGCLQLNLGTPAPAGQQLTLTSANSSALHVAIATSSVCGNFSAAGPTATVTLSTGQSTVYFVVDGMENQTGTIGVTASSPGYNSATATVVVAPLALRWIWSTVSLTTLTPPALTGVGVGPQNAAGTASAGDQSVRPGGVALSVQLTSNNPTVADFVVTGGASGATVTTTVVPGQMFSTSSGTGTPQLRPLSSGTTTVSAVLLGAPGAINPTPFTTTVTAPSIVFQTPTGVRVGAGLRSSCLQVNLGAPATTGMQLTIASTNSAMLLISPTCNTTATASASTTITLTAGQTSTTFLVDGIEGQSGSVGITASSPAFNTGNATIVVAPLAIRWVNSSSNTTTLSPNSLIRVGVSPVNAAGTLATSDQSVRPGGTPITVDFSTSNPSVADLSLVGGGTGSMISAIIGLGQMYTPSSGAGTPELRPRAIGSTNLNATIRGAIGALAAPQITTSVSTPALSFQIQSGSVAVGARSSCQLVQFGAPAVAGMQLTVTSSNGAVIEVASNPSCGITFGARGPSASIPLTTGQTNAYFVVYGMQQTGTVTLTATLPGFSDATRTFTTVP